MILSNERDDMARAIALEKAYTGNEIPFNGAFILSSFFDSNSIYTIYEVTAYKNVKDIFFTDEGLTFKTDGTPHAYSGRTDNISAEVC